MVEAGHQALVAADGSGRADGSRHRRSFGSGSRPPRTDLVLRRRSRGIGMRRMMLEDQGELTTIQAAADRLAVSRWMSTA